MGGGKKKSSSLPTASITTDGLYGSANAGLYSSLNANDFQKNLVNTTEKGINSYLNQLINPSYDSEVFKAQTAQRNALANESFENNLINPLYSRGLVRGSNLNTLNNSFANSLASETTEAMANEDTRVQNVLSELLDAYQIPYDMLTGLQKTAASTANASANNSARDKSTNANIFSTIFNGLF